MDANQVCINCKTQIQYIPFICDLCGGFMCLDCTGEDGTAFCESCKDIQAVSIELAKPQPKCTYCDKDALFVEECMPNNKKKNKKSKDMQTEYRKHCPYKIQVCKDHIKRCEECNRMICDHCAEYNRCRDHIEYCNVCNQFVIPSKLVKCANCKKKQCNSCLIGTSLYSGNVMLTSNLMLCGSHITKCKCTDILYDAPVFACTYPYCRKVVCRSGWFKSTVNATIYACHDHRSQCPVCDKIYPNINTRSITFRGDVPWMCCSNCYGIFSDGVVGLLSVWIENPLIRQIPKDVLGIIFRQHLQNIKKNRI